MNLAIVVVQDGEWIRAPVKPLVVKGKALIRIDVLKQLNQTINVCSLFPNCSSPHDASTSFCVARKELRCRQDVSTNMLTELLSEIWIAISGQNKQKT